MSRSRVQKRRKNNRKQILTLIIAVFARALAIRHDDCIWKPATATTIISTPISPIFFHFLLFTAVEVWVNGRANFTICATLYPDFKQNLFNFLSSLSIKSIFSSQNTFEVEDSNFFPASWRLFSVLSDLLADTCFLCEAIAIAVCCLQHQRPTQRGSPPTSKSARETMRRRSSMWSFRMLAHVHNKRHVFVQLVEMDRDIFKTLCAGVIFTKKNFTPATGFLPKGKSYYFLLKICYSVLCR